MTYQETAYEVMKLFARFYGRGTERLHHKGL